jgi:hypothetical protein
MTPPGADEAKPTAAAISVSTQTNATQTAINTNIAARFGQGGGFTAGQSNIFVSTRGMDKNIAQFGEPELNAWVALEGRRFSGNATGDSANLTFGLDRLVNPNLILGGFVSVNDQALKTSGQETETKSPLIGAYAAQKINESLFFSGFVGYGHPKYSVSGTDYTSTRKILGLSLNGSYTAGAYLLKPDLSVLATQEDIPNSAASTADQLNDTQTKLTLRIEPAARFANGLLPYASLAADYRRSSSNLNSAEDFTKPRFAIGMDWEMAKGSLRIDLDYGTVSSGVNDLGAALTYNLRF